MCKINEEAMIIRLKDKIANMKIQVNLTPKICPIVKECRLR